MKALASREWWEPGTSRDNLNITSELQLPNAFYMKKQVDTDGVPPLQGRHIIVCLGGL